MYEWNGQLGQKMQVDGYVNITGRIPMRAENPYVYQGQRNAIHDVLSVGNCFMNSSSYERNIIMYKWNGRLGEKM